MDLREYWDDPEEALRTALDGFRKTLWTSIPGIVSEDSKDGHSVKVKLALKYRVLNPKTGKLEHKEFPMLEDVPIHFPQGGKTVSTYPVKQGDEGILLFANRMFDAWRQSGGVQQTIDTRMHSLSDAKFIPGIRSDPRKLQNVNPDAVHHRSEDAKHTVEIHPTTGIKTKSVDPSDGATDPFNQAKKFFESIVHPSNGVAHNATDNGTTHTVGVTHTDGAFMEALNALHKVLAHPTLGALLAASNMQHLVQAHPQNGVIIQSAKAIALSAPSLSLPAGGIQAGSFGAGSIASGDMKSGAAAGNVGTLGGDLAGTLPNPTVVGLTHIVNANLLPVAASDAAAAALTPPVPIGGLYVNTSAISGQNLLCVRLA